MFDFVIAGIIYLLILFIVLFCLSFVTVGVAYAVAMFIRRCLGWRHQPDLALK